MNKDNGLKLYDKKFYEGIIEDSQKSAEEVLTYLLERISLKSVIDFGCGAGTWLAEAKKIDESISVLGIDFGGGTKAVSLLGNDEKKFMDLSKPIRFDQKYDMAISLEVAEHIEEQFSDVFIDNICESSDLVLFSAAHLLQGGTGHVNEQRLSYWIDKFQRRGYEFCDYLRPVFWDNKNICVWYRTNMVLFATGSSLDIVEKNFRTEKRLIDVIHPEYYEITAIKAKSNNKFKETKREFKKVFKTLLRK